MKTLYTAEALATGEGRDGHGRTSDGKLDFDLAIPKDMGGSGNGTNPEQLFAIGYASCFESALMAAARRERLAVDDVAIDSQVSLIPTDDRRFLLGVVLDVTLPSIEDPEQAVALVDAAHQVCPYSNATRGNIDVELTANGQPVHG
jgi:lipoyl-dependent peroxiredoxin